MSRSTVLSPSVPCSIRRPKPTPRVSIKSSAQPTRVSSSTARDQVPAELHYNGNLREGDPVVIAKGPYMIRAHSPPAGQPDNPPPWANMATTPTR